MYKVLSWVVCAKGPAQMPFRLVYPLRTVPRLIMMLPTCVWVHRSVVMLLCALMHDGFEWWRLQRTRLMAAPYTQLAMMMWLLMC